MRLANFVMARSSGLRTALRRLGAGYREAGHEPVLIIPGATASDAMTEQGRVITLPGLSLPGTGGYRVMVGRRRLKALLEELEPDRLEVSDRWLLDRSTDLVPYLLRMALAEWWLDVRGAAHRLDEGVQAEIAAALHGIDERALA